ncbi:hypothetical protein VK792_10250 [Mesobacterium sp. TK19101]|uniref:Activity regulator of membrane protease YbbK n=1 Tax=Mesobacterium hydrothermale TaxID=3111907 RepID=A0ABU6HIC6_9RHOB|nr:hypothetical protein [Mesobacterium sp. TK19101]MEC3861666.1 hypothetical protein [Mesobacterium sp. TK19101]
MAWLSLWWVWLSAALALAILEVLAPGFVFLGFALGALAVSVLVALGLSPAASILMALWAGLSLAAWIGLKLAFRGPKSNRKIIREDIND